MFQFPPIPAWDALHPIVIHFPIALLMIAPLFVVVGALLAPTKGKPYMIVALALLLVGTAGTFLAVETGEAAAELAERTPAVERVLQTHEALAERTRAVFSVLSVIFLALLAIPQFLKKAESRLTSTILPLAFVILYSAGMLLLLNTAHNGGRLVHEFGLRAMMSTSLPDPSTAAPVAVEAESE